jgi:hypothetical protein
MLISPTPTNWRALQVEVARILSECGMESQVEHPLPLVRGQADIDVYAIDSSIQPPTVYACECKHWAKAVNQGVVHAFRQVVTDAGANWGLLVAKSGFQSGAFEAAEKSNVRLLTWEEFNEMFASRWVHRYFKAALEAVSDPLIDYTEDMNPKVIRNATPFNDAKRKHFAELRFRYRGLAFFCLSVCRTWGEPYPLALPLRSLDPKLVRDLPDDVLNQTSLRQLLERLTVHIEAALPAFDRIFGGRI